MNSSERYEQARPATTKMNREHVVPGSTSVIV